MSTIFWWSACALVATVMSGPVAAEETPVERPEEWVKTTESWFEPVREGGRVSVDNPYGAIFVRFGGYEDKVEILATGQRLEPDLPELEVARKTVEGDLLVEVRISGRDGAPVDRRDRIDLVVFVPIGRHVELSTIEDQIAVKGLRGDLTIRTIKGDVSLRKIEGAVDVRSERGNVTALLETGVTKQDQRFDSITGEIEVTVYEDANLDVSVATSGVISTDFSIEIEHRRFEEPGKQAHARIGTDGPKLSITSKRSKVSLLRQQKYFTRGDEGSS